MTPRLAEILAAMVAAALDTEAGRGSMRSPAPRPETPASRKGSKEDRRHGPGARG